MQSRTTILSFTSTNTLSPLFQRFVLPSLYRAPEPEITCGSRKSRSSNRIFTKSSCGSNRAITVRPSGQRKLSHLCSVSALVVEQLNVIAKTIAAELALPRTFAIRRRGLIISFFTKRSYATPFSNLDLARHNSLMVNALPRYPPASSSCRNNIEVNHLVAALFSFFSPTSTPPVSRLRSMFDQFSKPLWGTHLLFLPGRLKFQLCDGPSAPGPAARREVEVGTLQHARHRQSGRSSH